MIVAEDHEHSTLLPQDHYVIQLIIQETDMQTFHGFTTAVCSLLWMRHRILNDDHNESNTERDTSVTYLSTIYENYWKKTANGGNNSRSYHTKYTSLAL